MCGDVRMIQRGERLRLALEPRQAIGIGANGSGRILSHVATELGVACAVDLAHAARPKGGEDSSRAQACAGGEGHSCSCGLYGRELASGQE